MATTSMARSAQPQPDPDMLLIDYFDRIYAPLKLRGKSRSTLTQYRINIRHFERFLERGARLSDLEDGIVGALLGSFIDRGKSPATANKCRNHLLAMWRYAARKHHVPEFPDVDRMPEVKRTPTSFTPEQMGRLLDVMQNHACKYLPDAIAGISTRLWWASLITTLYDTGLRISAAMALKCDDYDPEAKRIFISGLTQKELNDQVLYVSEQTAGYLDASIKQVSREKLFPWPWTIAPLYKQLRRFLEMAGLPTDRRSKFHRIRRTTATQCEIVAPGHAQELLGHSSPQVTARYIDRSLLPHANIAARLPRPVQPNRPAEPVEESFRLIDLIADYARWVKEHRAHKDGLERRYPVEKISFVVDQAGFEYVRQLDADKARATWERADWKVQTSYYYRSEFRRFLGWLVFNRGFQGAALKCFEGI